MTLFFFRSLFTEACTRVSTSISNDALLLIFQLKEVATVPGVNEMLVHLQSDAQMELMVEHTRQPLKSIYYRLRLPDCAW